MHNRRIHDSEDNPIGLTGAFAPVQKSHSVEYDVNDNPVGLTEAFAAVTANEEEHSWVEEEKWKDFNWDAALGELDTPSETDAFGAPVEAYGEADEIPPQVSISAKTEASFVNEEFQTNSSQNATAEQAEMSTRKPSVGHGRHAAPEKALSPRMKKSRRTRRVLLVLLVLLVLVAGAVGFFWYRTWTGSHQEAAQQTQEQVEAPDGREDIANMPTNDATETTSKLADVPNLASLLGKTQDEAIAALGRGASVTANAEVNEDGNPIKVNLNVALTDEPAVSKAGGTPMVYLGLNEAGSVCQAGYSAPASALGFGVLSFADAVSNEHVVEKTLEKIGVAVPDGAVVLPENKDEYSTYASDKKTVIRERCSFEGDVELNGIPCTWSSVLSYDYTTQVITGNLNDTVRIIYVYITMKQEL